MTISSSGQLDLAALFDLHQRQLLGLTLRITGDFALAEDALQETFLSAHRAAEKFRGECAPATWLFRIAAREAIRQRARRDARRARDLQYANQDRSSGPDRQPAADTVLSWREKAQRLLSALDRLPDDQRLALILLSVRELPAGEIARLLGVTPATVYTRAFRARQRLNELLGGDDLPAAPARA